MKTKISLFKLALVALIACGGISAYGAATTTITGATGGSSISADNTGTATFTSLTGPSMICSGGGTEISTGTLILNCPNGFVWDAGGTAPSASVTGTGSGAVTFTSRTSTAVTFTVGTAVTSGSTVTFSGLRVQPSAGTPLAINTNITRSGTATVSGQTSANYGTLTEIAGAAAALAFGTQPSDTIFNQTISPAVTVQIADQFGNPTGNGSASITVAIGNNPASGTLSGATTVAASSGTATFNNLSINNVGSGYTLTATSSGLTGATSSAFRIRTATGFTVKTRVTGANNWSTAATWEKVLSGTATFSTGSTNVTGTGTHFTTEVAVNDVLVLDSSAAAEGTVYSITDDTHLALTAKASANGASVAYGKEAVPTSTDEVQIGNTALGGGVTLTLDTSPTINSMTFIADNQTSSLTDSGTHTLAVNNDVALNQGTSGGKQISWAINAGTATIGGNLNLNVSINNANTFVKVLTTTGSLTVSGNINFSDTVLAANGVIDLSGGAGTLNIGGNLNVTTLGTLTPGTSSTVNFNGTAGQTIPIGVSAVTYNNVNLNNASAGGAAISAAITSSLVTGNVSVQSGTFNNSGFAIALASGKNLSVSNNAAFNLTGTSGMATFSGGGTNIFATNSTVAYSGTTQTVGSAPYGNLILGSGTKTLTSPVIVSNSLYFTNSAVASLTSGGTYLTTALWTNAVPLLVGSWGNTGSGATHINTAIFTGTGKLYVGNVSGIFGQQSAQLTASGSSITVKFYGVKNYTYTVQRSTDLVTWTDMSTITDSTGPFTYTDSSAPSQAYYRLKWQP